jgi:GT2 family glycosyltransferase
MKSKTIIRPKINGSAADGQQTSDCPALSVIVPVYNSTAYLQQCLAALAQSEYSHFEVLVVDDGSTEMVEPVVAAYGFRYLRIDGPGGPARARNRGAAEVTGQYLVFVDADVCVHRDTLGYFAEGFNEDPELAAIVGSYDDTPAEPGFLSQYKNLFHHYIHQQSSGEITTFWSGCGAMRRELFLAFGGFDEQRYRRPAIEDIELGTWITAAGHRIILDRRIKGMHLKRWTLLNLLKTDIFDRGIPWTRLMLRAGAFVKTLNVTVTQRLSVALVYLTALTTLSAMCRPVAWIGVGALALIVTILNFDFYRYFAVRSGWWFALRVLPLHWLYFGYCGLSAIFGTLLHYLASDPGCSPFTTPAKACHGASRVWQPDAEGRCASNNDESDAPDNGEAISSLPRPVSLPGDRPPARW